MNRLTDNTSVEFTPECNKVNPLNTKGKCPYYDKLKEYEDFMEDRLIESLEDIDETLIKFKKNIDVIYKLKQENQVLKDRLEELKKVKSQELADYLKSRLEEKE